MNCIKQSRIPLALMAVLASATVISHPVLQAAEPLPVSMFKADGDLEVTLWAASPLLANPTNIDIDARGRIWVAEGVNYRGHYSRQPGGDRIVVLEDSDLDGTADKQTVFVQEPFLRAPMGIAVIDNKVVVSMTPSMIIYTDVDRNGRFDVGVDTREILLTGFNGRSHDHSIHSVTVGPEGAWYWNAGNCGAMFTDRSGKTFRIGSAYDPYYGRRGPGDFPWNPIEIAGQKSDDGHVYIGGFAARMEPDGSNVQIIGHNFRNSYEQTVTSFGDVFHSDNDDPPACRTSFLLEYGNAGFCSEDGKRSWQADRRPGQSTAVAEWRQEDPGTMPPGDVYGGGSPTGVAFYENGALPDKYQGLLLTCEPGRNTVFGYLPEPQDAGFKLERFNFLSTNPDGQFAGTDFKGGSTSPNQARLTLFRPSDVCVGPDGAIYVADWFDPRVGGHQDLDNALVGAIYRIAPKGFRARQTGVDLRTEAGMIAAFKSPAVHVRALGFQALKARGGKSVESLTALLHDDNPYIKARTLWLLAQCGPRGTALVERYMREADPRMRVTSYRALRHVGYKTGELTRQAATDASPAVRREAALALRNLPWEQSGSVLVTLAQRYDGKDRTYLEALGTGATGKESALYDALLATLGQGEPTQWSKAFADIAWRLHPGQSVAAFEARALAERLSTSQRKAAVTALGFIHTQESATAVTRIAAKTKGSVRDEAVWWILNRKGSTWKGFGLETALRDMDIYDPNRVELVAAVVPPAPASTLPPAAEILKLTGDVARGKQVASACLACHQIADEGVDYAPDLTRFASMQAPEVVVQSIADPSADISHGFGGQEISLKNGTVIHGIVLNEGDPLIVRSQGGLTQMIPADRIQARKPFNRSLMLSAEQMGLGAQELADVYSYLRETAKAADKR